MSNKPPPERLADVYRRLLAGDPVAPAELAELAIEPLAYELTLGKRRLRDETFAIDAATDAVLDFAKRPGAYDPSAMAVWSFLCMAARRNLANRLLAERRHTGRVFRFGSVELRARARNRDSESPLDGLAEAEFVRRRLEELGLDSFSPEDLAILRLMADGERDTARFAAVTGIADRSREEQSKLVKQAKDRLLKRLRRSASEGSDD